MSIERKYNEYKLIGPEKKNDRKRERIHREIDDILTTNKAGKGDYDFYPENTDEDFIFNLSKRLEYFHLKSLFNITELSNKCPLQKLKMNDPFNFELTNNQQFLKNFMNRKTPYKGLVIFHGVGVGKTCSAINISKSYRDTFTKTDKKIICLVPKNIRGGWENTIYDPSKGNEQCSGDSFEDTIVKDKKGNVGKKDVKNLIRQHYDFYGYLAFANNVEKLIKNEIGNRDISPEMKDEIEKDVIHKNFSYRVLIVDEVHNLREENEIKDKKFRKGDEVFNQENGKNVFIIKKLKEDKFIVRDKDGIEETIDKGVLMHLQLDQKAKEIIEKVIRYSKGMRIILLSATPMFNKSSEIIWLLNLLLKNDNRPIIRKEEIFDGEKLRPEGRDILLKKTTGYFSYLRGENPITFPIRFYPDINSDKNCIGGDYNPKIKYRRYPQLTLFGERIDPNDNFKFMKMYGSKMYDKGHQKEIYDNFVQEEIMSVEKYGINLSNRNIGTQISNIVFFNDGDNHDFKDKFGQRGFENTFKSRVSRKSRKCSYLDESNKILARENLKSYSIKIHTIIENMLKNKSEGIIFIYSDYIFSGILPIAIALEHIGFEKYNGENILETREKINPISYNFEPLSKKNNKKAKYIILTGDKTLSPNNEKERKDSLNYNNINGENIKVILGNSVTSEGMDFKNIREIHVLDPWYHLYKIEQIIGRGIRYCSHSFHPKNKQNVTVFLHTALADDDVESIDTNTYLLAEKKASDIGEIEKILKDNAIDSFLNKDINHITGLKPIHMSTTWKKWVNVDINDKDYTKICSFLKDGCEINVNSKIEDELKDKKPIEIIDDTFTLSDISESIKVIYSIVKELFEIYEMYTLNELKYRIKEIIDTDDRIIEHGLDYICDDKKIIWNKKDVPGYIVNINNCFLFQPGEINDVLVPFSYRTGERDKEENTYENIFSSIKVEFKNTFHCDSSYNDIYQKLKNIDTIEIEKEIQLYKGIIDDLKRTDIKDHFIDSLTYDEKVVLLKEILCGYIVSGGKKIQDNYDAEIFNFFEDNLLYENDGQYYGFEKRGKVVGFFLCNPSKYNKIQDVFNNFDYYEYNGEWKYLDEVGIQMFKNNIIKNKALNRIFKTDKFWGYSFKEDKTKHVFKFVYEKINIYDNEPGKVIGDKGFPMLTLLQEYMNNFPKEHGKYLNSMEKILKNKLNKTNKTKIEKTIKDYGEDKIGLTKFLYKELRNVGNPDIIKKEFITKMYEYTLRNSSKKYFSYDTFLFKFVKTL